MGYIYLLLVVCGITATALLAKLASQRNVTALDLSTSLFAVSTVLGAMILIPKLPLSITASSLWVSSIAGVGGALAVLAFNMAVRTGHFGYSNAIYRSAFLLPVVFSLFFLHGVLKSVTALGIVLILAAIFLMSRSSATSSGGKIQLTWLLLILSAFLLSGAPRIGQILTKAWSQNYYFYLFFSYATGAVVLLTETWRRRSFNPSSLTWGAGAAVASYIGVLCTLKALETLPPEVVFPISLSGPIVLGMVLSLFLFKEKITVPGWIGAALGVTGITLLAVCK